MITYDKGKKISPITHFLISWSIANSCDLSRKDRAIITLAGLAPDIDAAGIMIDFFIRSKEQPYQLYHQFHHIWGHNIGFGLLMVIIALFISSRRKITAMLVFLVFNIHLVCDLIGSKGPGGYQWPIPYLLPFSDSWQWVVEFQWKLNAWPNFVITISFLIFTMYYAWKKGLSPLEIVSIKANNIFVDTLRQRFGRPV